VYKRQDILSVATALDSAISDVVATAVTETASIVKVASDAYSLATIAPVGASTHTVNLLQSDNSAAKQAKIDAVDRYIPEDATITFQFETGVTHTETTRLTWKGFYGGGQINIYGNTAEAGAATLHTNQDTILDFTTNSVWGLFINNNAVRFLIRNFMILIKDDAGSVGVYTLDNNLGIYVSYSYILGENAAAGYGILFESGVFHQTNRNYYSEMLYANAISKSRALCVTCDDTGVQPGYGLYAYQASTVGKTGTQVTGGVLDELEASGGVIR